MLSLEVHTLMWSSNVVAQYLVVMLSESQHSMAFLQKVSAFVDGPCVQQQFVSRLGCCVYFCCTLCVHVTPVLCADAPETTVMTCQYNKYYGEFEELRKEEL